MFDQHFEFCKKEEQEVLALHPKKKRKRRKNHEIRVYTKDADQKTL